MSDPRKPRKVWEFNAPPGIHMHKLRLVGDNFLYVNAERIGGWKGELRTGIFIFDISRPAEPRQVGFYDMPINGPHRFGIDKQRQLALLPAPAEGWNEKVIWTMDIRDPLKPEIISIWGLPWQKKGGPAAPTTGTGVEHVCRMHGPPVIRGNRMFGAFWGGGVAVIDCSDLSDMKLVGHVNWSPPFVGGSHTAWPLGDRPYLIVTDEARARQKFWDSQFMWIVDIRDEANPLAGRVLLPRAGKILRPAGTVRSAQRSRIHAERRPLEGHRLSDVFQRRTSRRRRERPAAAERGRAFRARRSGRPRRASSRTTSATTEWAGSI